MRKTNYLQTAANDMPRISLAQVEVDDITARLAELTAKRDTSESNIERMNAALHGGWRHAAKDTSTVEQITADLEREHRLLKLQEQLIEAAKADLAAAQLRVTTERIGGVAEKFNALMTSKTEKARNVVATCFQLAAMVKELDLIDRQALGLFTVDPALSGLTHSQAMQYMGKVKVQGFIETLLESQLVDQRLWVAERPIWGYPKDVQERLVDAVDAERTATLAGINLVLERITNGGALSPTREADAAMDSMRAAQAKASASARANGVV